MTGADSIEGFTRLIGAVALLASYKIGRGGGRTRARQRLARGAVASPRNALAASGRGSSSTPGPLESARRYRDRLRAAAAVFWIALLLSIIAYAGVRGEVGLAELEAMGISVAAGLD